jgi:ABC-type multidrug transport system fused ATPase/permease subunit
MNVLIYLLKKTWKYSREERWKVVLFYILHTISYGGELLQPYAFATAINSLISNGIENLSPTLGWLGLYVIGFFIFQIFHHSARYFEISTAFRNQQRFINDMYSKVYDLPMKWHIDHHSGEVVNRINTAAQSLRDFGFAQYQYLGNLLLSLGPIIILATISWEISAICLILTVLNLLIVDKLNKKIQPILNRKNECSHSYAARLIDFVGNIKTVISLRLKKETSEELDKKFDNYYKENMNEVKINQPRCFLIAFGGIVTQVILIIFYLWTCNSGGQIFMAGTLVMLVDYFEKMRDAFFEITSNFYETLHWKTALQSVNPILEALAKEGLYEDKEIFNSWQNISIRNLNFRYGKDKQTLSSIDLDVNKESKIALVGLSGSGKSTLINVLAGFYEPDEVKLLLDGKKHSKLDLITNSTILVQQDVEIFENTIEYNITFGLQAKKEELEKVIKEARFDEVLERLPKGIKTDVREKGVNLSGGEKQRLALARGLFFSKGKRMLLLDEVTSNIDVFNEKLIFEQIIQNYKDRSIICTIHRLHLLDMFDTVIVMGNGHIVQKGKFSQLIATEGYFKKLWEQYLITDMSSENEVTKTSRL